MNRERQRLQNKDWKIWGPYISDRQWGTVREDYSENGDAWRATTHEMARSKAYRWGEEGIAGWCDNQQLICFALAFWNKKDPIIKERYFGLTDTEGNHGEDVKELYYYLDATPSHSYMKMLYKYPQAEFPYERLASENKVRNKTQTEFELIDTGIFSNDEYFDIFVEYAKADCQDSLIQITLHNRGSDDASLTILPTVWFRNTWAYGSGKTKPQLAADRMGNLLIEHPSLGSYTLYLEQQTRLLFCDNETNSDKLYNYPRATPFCKDGINDYITTGNQTAINKHNSGTKAAAHYEVSVKANDSYCLRLRLCKQQLDNPFSDFAKIFSTRLAEANEFYAQIQHHNSSHDEKLVQRQAFAGMLWSKQFYYYDVGEWLQGDPAGPTPPKARQQARNKDWQHLNNADIISMPDKWEYPWYASWDLAFHCIPLAMIDPDFAKGQLQLLTREWYMHPNGQLPAYEWNFSDVNPPVHAWSAFRVFKIDEKISGRADTAFLESVFHKLLLNFTWWVNRKDKDGNNVFSGGFLGLDNISLFDRSAPLPAGGYLEQADATSWMAMYSLNLMRIALELALYNPVYQDMATKFFEHFLYIAKTMDNLGENNQGLWDDSDSFYYDVLKLPGGRRTPFKVRTMVGLIPLFAVEVLDHQLLVSMPDFARRLRWFLAHRPALASLVSRWNVTGNDAMHLLSLLRGHRMKKILERVLDESEFLSDYGVRSLSKYYENNPYQLQVNGEYLGVSYVAAESDSFLFGGNSNWRGPIWLPVNFLLIESLRRFYFYYGEDFKIECPRGSGIMLTLNQVADELSQRLAKLVLRNKEGERPVFGNCEKMQRDPHFNDYILFYEYFHGDSGRGMGAAHQTGWTGLLATILQPRRTLDKT